MAGKVEKELSAATGVTPKAKENRQAFLKRLLGAVSDLGDKEFKDLSTAAQKWNNSASPAFDKDEELPETDAAAPAEKAAPAKGKAKPAPAEADDDDQDPGADAEEDETTGEDDAEQADDAETEDTDVKTSKTPAKKATTKTAAKAPAKAAPAKAKAAAPAAKKKAPVERVGVIDALKDVLTEAKTGLTVAQIHAKLLKKFPDRGDAMINTIRTQLSLLPGKGFSIKKAKTDDGVTYKHGK